MNEDDIVDYLRHLPDERFLALLGEVFRTKEPYPDEEASQSHYFLGIATRRLEGKMWAPAHWGPWEISGVATIDQNKYGEQWDNGPDWGFCQGGTCTGCGSSVVSNVKNGICPVCSAEVFLT